MTSVRENAMGREAAVVLAIVGIAIALWTAVAAL